jgi:hypothetical protein
MTNHPASVLQRHRELSQAFAVVAPLGEGPSWPCTRYSKTGRARPPHCVRLPDGASGHGASRAGTRRSLAGRGSALC